MVNRAHLRQQAIYGIWKLQRVVSFPSLDRQPRGTWVFACRSTLEAKEPCSNAFSNVSNIRTCTLPEGWLEQGLGTASLNTHA